MFEKWRYMDEADADGADAGGSGDEEKARIAEALKKANGEAAANRKRAKELEEKLAAFEGIDVDEFRKLKESQMTAEQKQQAKEAEYQKSIGQLQDQIGELNKRYDREVIDKALIGSLAKNGAIDPDETSILIRNQIGRDEHGAFVKDTDGSPMLVDGRRVTVEEFTKDWLEKRPHLVKAGSGGSGAKGGRGEDGVRTMNRAEFDKLDANGRVQAATAVRSGKLKIVNG